MVLISLLCLIYDIALTAFKKECCKMFFQLKFSDQWKVKGLPLLMIVQF